MSTQWPGLPADAGLDLLGQEILAEKAAGLGRTAQKAEAALGRLKETPKGADGREAALKAAAEAVHAYFIQRELCGFRKHDDVIRDLGIPRAVLVRLGAK